MNRVQALYRFPTWGVAQELFGVPVDVPVIENPEVAELLNAVEDWRLASKRTIDSFDRLRVSKRFVKAGRVVRDGLWTAAGLDAKVSRDWLADPEVPTTHKEAYFAVRDHLNDLLRSLAAIGREAFIAASFDMPAVPGPIGKRLDRLVGDKSLFGVSPTSIAVGLGGSTTTKMAQLLGGKRILGRETGILGLFWGGLSIYRDSDALKVIVRDVRRTHEPELSQTARSLIERYSKERIGEDGIEETRKRHLLRAYDALIDAGVTENKIDLLLRQALHLGEETSSQSWKGLVKLLYLVKYEKLDPTKPSFTDALSDAMTAGIQATSRRGEEYYVNDWAVARALLALDSRYVDADGQKHSGRTERPDDAVVRISQKAPSVLPGIVASNDDLVALGAHYHDSLNIHLNAIVTQTGDWHQRHKKTFDGYFNSSEIAKLSGFIEHTMNSVLDYCAEKAAANDGVFDFRRDFAFNFPIRITCEILGMPPDDVEQFQDWTQRSMRSLDSAAGMNLATIIDGAEATNEFKAYLSNLIDCAKRGVGPDGGAPLGGAIGDIGRQIAAVETGTLAADDDQISGTLIGAIAAATTEEEKAKALDAIVCDLGVLVFAGFETTMSSVSMGMHEILKRDGYFEFLKAGLVAGPQIRVDGRLVPDADLRWYGSLPKRADGSQKSLPAVVEARLSADDKERSRNITVLLEGSRKLRERLSLIDAQEAMLKNAAEEIMRWTAAGSVIPMTVSADVPLQLASPCATTMEGRLIEEGEMLHFPAGVGITVDVRATNRGRPTGRSLGAGGCPFAEGTLAKAPNDFDISREAQVPAKGHLSFGSGAHVCMGANLAVENTKRMLEAIARRCPDLRSVRLPTEADTTLFMQLVDMPVRSNYLAEHLAERLANSAR